MPISWHDDDPDLLREAIRFTAAETGFIPRLIEKDYFCSVLLEQLVAAGDTLTFKGGTCLAKIHSGFYRLSEDLDFTISTAAGATRATRNRNAAAMKPVIAAIPRQLPAFQIVEPLTGSNSSTQYNALFSYQSLLGAQPETISVEIALREPTLTAHHMGAVRTALLNPLHGDTMVQTFSIACLSYEEAMAEKLRAALTRREAAIRDFFDIDHAKQNGGLDPSAPEITRLLRLKLAVAGTGPVDTSPAKLQELRLQLDAQLRPVLRPREFEQFDLQRAFETVRLVATGLT